MKQVWPKSLTLGCLAILLVVLSVTRSRAQGVPEPGVAGVRLNVSPARFSGSCPAEINFTGHIVANGRVIVRYRFERSNGELSRVETTTFNGPDEETVSSTWAISPAVGSPSFDGWVVLRVLTPNEVVSNRANFTVRCTGPAVPIIARFAVHDFQPQIDRTGPINWIARNPQNENEVFVSSITSGLWKSTDGGRNWALIKTLPPWSVSAVAYLFDDTPGGAVLVTTREDFRLNSGAGVWRSNDHGTTWKQLAQVPIGCSGPSRAHGIAVRERSVTVATSCGVLTSPDGRSFSKFPATAFYPEGALTGPNPEVFYSVEYAPDGSLLLGGESGFFFRMRKASAPSGAALNGDNGEMRRVFAISSSPRNPQFVLALSGNQGTLTMLVSQDYGQNWAQIASPITSTGGGSGGSPFVRIFRDSARSEDYFVYFGNSWRLYRAGPFPNGDLSSLSTDSGIAWKTVFPGHPDPHDIDFFAPVDSPLDSRKLLLATDGGLEFCDFGSDAGGLPTCSESRVLGTASGLHPIQVTNVKGQLIGSGESSLRRLYFDSWHTDKWASGDDGRTWTRIAGEAALLEMERKIAGTADAQIVTDYLPLPITLSGDLMSGGVPFTNAPGTTSPTILQRGVFLRATNASTLAATTNLTRATISTASWTTVANLQTCYFLRCSPLPLFGAPILGGYTGPSKTNAIIYQPYSGGDGLAVVSGIVERPLGNGPTVSPGTVNFSAINWTDSTGATKVIKQGIAWTPFTGPTFNPVLGADPQMPTHLLVPDATNGMVLRSLNAGANWQPLIALSNLVKQDARGTDTFSFTIDRPGFGSQSLVSAISYCPDSSNLVIIGTVENGLFFSTDGALTWQRIPNTEHITNVVSLYWRSANSVIVGSWGRGLFEIRMTYTLPRSDLEELCGDCEFRTMEPLRVSRPASPFVSAFAQPASALPQKDFDEAVLVLGGSINGVEMEQGRLRKLYVTKGSAQYRFGNAKSNLQFDTEEQSGFLGFKDVSVADQLRKDGNVVKGLAFTKGRLTHVIYGSKQTPMPVQPSLGPVTLPKRTDPEIKNPYLRVTGPEMVLGTIGIGKPFTVEGYLFNPNTPLELSVDGGKQAQIRTDADGHFAAKMVAPSAIGPHEIVVRNQVKSVAAIGFGVSNSDEARPDAGDKRAAPKAKKEDLRAKKDEQKPPPTGLLFLPRVFSATELFKGAKAQGDQIRLTKSSGEKGEVTSLDWSVGASGDQLTLSFVSLNQSAANLYGSFKLGVKTGSVRVRVLVNGRQVERVIDLTSPPVTMENIELGMVEIRPGTNTVTFIVMDSKGGYPITVSLLALALTK